MNDDLFLRAGAYLDADFDIDPAASRADRAVADAAADIERLRSILAAVRPAQRVDAQRMISSAMDHFAVSKVSAEHRVGSDQRRRPQVSTRQVLSLAAGCVAVLAVGFATARTLQRSSDETAIEEPAAFEMAADEPAEALVEEAADSAASSASTDAIMALEVITESPVAGEPPAEEPAAEAASDEMAATNTADQAPLDDEEVEARLTVEVGQVLTSPEELGVLGGILLDDARAGVLPPTPNTRCPVAEALSWAPYLLDGVVIEVVVAVDVAAGTVSAIEPDGCEVVAVGPLAAG